MKLRMMRSNRLVLNQKKINSNHKNGFVKKFILILLIIIGLGYAFFYLKLNSNIYLDKKVVIKKGDDINKFYSNLSKNDLFFFKLYLKANNIDNIKIIPGIYDFTGSYSKYDFIKIIQDGPKNTSFKLTIFEGNNIYDIDQKLVNLGLISAGEYIALATDKEIIAKYKAKYDFLKYIPEDKNTLEGFLYPDTYQLSSEGNIADRLIYLQLEDFKIKLWDKHRDELVSFSTKLSNNGYKMKLSVYGVLTLASIIEKEEKTSKNKPVIAGIFLNRLDNNRRLDADISLCYGLKLSMADCNGHIFQNVDDKTNPYNTRKVKGLTPTPIGNPSLDSVSGLLNFTKSEYFFYLHGSDGGFYPAKTLDEHNYNIQKHLNN